MDLAVDLLALAAPIVGAGLGAPQLLPVYVPVYSADRMPPGSLITVLRI